MGEPALKISDERYFCTPQEYLMYETEAVCKSEYFDGEVIAMAGGSLNHSRISGNIHNSLNNRLYDKPCEAFNSDLKLDVEEECSYFYPDVMVVCSKIEFAEKRNDVIKNPIMVVEVLSPSTIKRDLGIKLQAYQTIPSLKEYVVVYQSKAMLQCYFKNSENNWQFSIYEKWNEPVKFQSLNIEMPMNEIYRKVDFSAIETLDSVPPLFAHELIKAKP